MIKGQNILQGNNTVSVGVLGVLSIVSGAQVCLTQSMGDFNAHTGDAPDIDTVADHVLEDLGLGLDELVSTSHVPVRRSTMDSSVNDMGRLLLSHCCLDSGLFLLNGRTHGDRSGKCTHAQSVIDYGLVDAPTYSCVQSFKVLAKEDESDHMPIECVLDTYASTRCIYILGDCFH